MLLTYLLTYLDARRNANGIQCLQIPTSPPGSLSHHEPHWSAELSRETYYGNRLSFVAGLGPRDHLTAAWRDLHWLPIDQRIIYKLWILMHAVRNGTAPTYIRDLVTQLMKSVAGLICGRLHLDISTYREPGQSSDQGPFRLRVLLHGTVFQRAFAN